MGIIRIRAIGKELKAIKYDSSDDVDKVIDYASFIITNASYTLFNGECIVRINGKEVASEDELRSSIRRYIRDNEDILVEIQAMRREIVSKRLPSEIVLHATSITPPAMIQR